LSGGQRQRVVIAMAVALKPKLLIADEPTTALDASIQRDIMTLIVNLQEMYNTALLLVSHDLSMVRHYASNVLVMHQGRCVEQGKVTDIFQRPQKTYTKTLLSSHPSGRPAALEGRDPLLCVQDFCVSYGIKNNI